MNPLPILIHGAHGRMGQALLRLCLAGEGGCSVVAAVSRREPQRRVVDGIGQFSARELPGVPQYAVAVDFSLAEGFDAILAECLRRKRPLVSGTTGLSDVQRTAMDAAAAQIPVLWAANFSLGVAMLRRLAAIAASGLPGWDCDIIEQHHAHKRDAPSGTALALEAAMRPSGTQPRHASIRAGDIVGEHTVQFTAPGERIELIHRAGSRDVFARGALQAARWLASQPPGRYDIDQLLG